MNLKSLKNLTLLYVEDEPLIRKNALEYLSRYCAKVYEAEDGANGYEVYKKERPNLIITDIKMPKLSGLELAEKIRQEDKNTPIIITTAHTDTEYLLKAVELQLVKYVVKPITSAKLKGALALACESLEEKQKSSIVYLDDSLYYDTLNQSLFRDKELIKLTHNEQLFFDFLVKHKERAITYEEIENLIWAYDGMSMDALRSLVRSVRKKLGGDFISNISGIGYRLVYLK